MNAEIPVVRVGPSTASALGATATMLGSLEAVEATARHERDRLLAQLPTDWQHTAAEIAANWQRHDYVLLRGVPADREGATGLLVASAVFPSLRTYRGHRIVKHFRMSPWTTELSHTLADGHFHTDINTAQAPPIATVIQCLEADPSGPAHGHLRVIRFNDLVDALQTDNAQTALKLLLEDTVEMVNDSDNAGWIGKIYDGSTVRFHPETLRAAQRRAARNPAYLEEALATIHCAAMGSTSPIEMLPGDTLLLSNQRALHYRSACTVRFRGGLRDFDSRSVAVLHTTSEPS